MVTTHSSKCKPDPVQLILDRLREQGRKVQQAGGGWSCQCTAHDDGRASLSVSRGGDGRALVHCFAGCTPEAIVEALGLKMADLMPPGNRYQVPERTGRDGKPEIVATYDYRDENGNLLYQAVRYMPKDFRQRRPDGKGGWIWSMQDVRRVLFRLPELLEHPDLPVWIVEGERDVESLRSRGFLATCNVGGAGKWRSEYSEFLRERTVCIIPDNDAPGMKHAEQVAEALRGVAASVKIVQIPTGGQP